MHRLQVVPIRPWVESVTSLTRLQRVVFYAVAFFTALFLSYETSGH